MIILKCINYIVTITNYIIKKKEMSQMKKLLLILGVLLIGITAFAGSYENELNERMKIIEEKAQIGLESGVSADMLNASYELEKAWEDEVNTLYKLILKKLPSKEKEKFKAEQQRWLNNRKKAIKKAMNDEEDGPRMAVFGAAGTGLSMTQKRAIELAKRYDRLNK